LGVRYEEGTELVLGNFGNGSMYDLNIVIRPMLYIAVQTLVASGGIEDHNGHYFVPSISSPASQVAAPTNPAATSNRGYLTNIIGPSESLSIPVQELIQDLTKLIPPEVPQGQWLPGATQTATVEPVIMLHVSYNTKVKGTIFNNFYIYKNSIIDQTIERAKLFPITESELTQPSIDGVRQALEALGWRQLATALARAPHRTQERRPQHSK
jgi:hypothetical protein